MGLYKVEGLYWDNGKENGNYYNGVIQGLGFNQFNHDGVKARDHTLENPPGDLKLGAVRVTLACIFRCFCVCRMFSPRGK